MSAIKDLQEKLASIKSHSSIKKFLHTRPLPISAKSLNAVMPVTLDHIIACFTAQQIRAMADNTLTIIIAPEQIKMYAVACYASYAAYLPTLETEAEHRLLWLLTRERTRRASNDFMHAVEYEFTPPTQAELYALAQAKTADAFRAKGFKVTCK